MRIPRRITWNQRFDFGVPLEDISFSGHINPRLKFLFEKAVEAVVNSGLNVEEILSNQQSLETRLHLKELLIFEVDYQKIDKFLPSTLLWVIRHFFGLLPIPLLPQYSNEVKFEWNQLSDQCQDYLKYGRRFQEDSYILDYVIVEAISFLPFEHRSLLNHLILFIRKLIRIFAKDLHHRKIQLMTIAKYFCGSIFIRPYRPGLVEEELLPLLIYLILKWHEIREVCAETGILIENSSNTEYGRFKETKITSLPVKLCHGSSVENNIITLEKTCLQDDSTQTEILYCFSKPCQTSLPRRVNNIPQDIVKLQHRSVQTDIVIKMDRTSQTAAQDFDDNSRNSEYENDKMNMTETFPLANSTAIISRGNMNETSQITNQNQYSYFTAPELTSKYYSIVNESIVNNSLPEYGAESLIEDFTPRGNGSEYLDKTPCSFFSAIDTRYEWVDIVKETSKTVKKMDEYIYDDYDTFAKEDFNQLFDENKVSVSHEKKESHLTNNPFIINGNKKINNTESNRDNSYLRFDDVDNVFTSNGSIHQIATKENNSDPLVRNSFSSEDKLYSPGKNSIYRETKNKIYFGLKRFKIKMNFLRLLTNKNISNKSMVDTYFNNSKYKRIKHVKANTL